MNSNKHIKKNDVYIPWRHSKIKKDVMMPYFVHAERHMI